MKRICRVFIAPQEHHMTIIRTKFGVISDEINEYAETHRLNIVSISPQDENVVWVLFEETDAEGGAK